MGKDLRGKKKQGQPLYGPRRPSRSSARRKSLRRLEKENENIVNRPRDEKFHRGKKKQKRRRKGFDDKKRSRHYVGGLRETRAVHPGKERMIRETPACLDKQTPGKGENR